MDFRQEFIEFALSRKVLRFGEFTPRRGDHPRIFLTPDCSTILRATAGAAGGILRQSGRSRRRAPRHVVRAGLQGILLVAAISIASAQRGHNFPFAFNRKEAKDHGEGGSIVGAPLTGACTDC